MLNGKKSNAKESEKTATFSVDDEKNSQRRRKKFQLPLDVFLMMKKWTTEMAIKKLSLPTCYELKFFRGKPTNGNK
jgi:hypothetical protein